MIVVALVADHTFRFVVNVYHGDDTADLTYYNFGMSIVDGKMNVFHGLVIPHDTIQPILPSIFVGKGSQLVAPVTFFVFNVAIQDQDFMYNVITGLLLSTILVYLKQDFVWVLLIGIIILDLAIVLQVTEYT